MPSRENTIVPERLISGEQLRIVCDRAAAGADKWAAWHYTGDIIMQPDECWTEVVTTSTKYIKTFKGIEFKINEHSGYYGVQIRSRNVNHTIHLLESSGFSLEEAKELCDSIIYKMAVDGYYSYMDCIGECVGVKIVGDSHVCIVMMCKNQKKFDKFLSKMKTKALAKDDPEDE